MNKPDKEIPPDYLIEINLINMVNPDYVGDT
jgi:hypothetical protein